MTSFKLIQDLTGDLLASVHTSSRFCIIFSMEVWHYMTFSYFSGAGCLEWKSLELGESTASWRTHPTSMSQSQIHIGSFKSAQRIFNRDENGAESMPISIDVHISIAKTGSLAQLTDNPVTKLCKCVDGCVDNKQVSGGKSPVHITLSNLGAL